MVKFIARNKNLATSYSQKEYVICGPTMSASVTAYKIRKIKRPAINFCSTVLKMP